MQKSRIAPPDNDNDDVLGGAPIATTGGQTKDIAKIRRMFFFWLRCNIPHVDRIVTSWCLLHYLKYICMWDFFLSLLPQYQIDDTEVTS